MQENYQRKVSSEEAAEGYIFILQNRLSFFPPVGEEFELRDGNGTSRACVEARACECRGPEKPHQHFFIRRSGLEKGQVVTIERAGGAFTLR